MTKRLLPRPSPIPPSPPVAPPILTDMDRIMLEISTRQPITPDPFWLDHDRVIPWHEYRQPTVGHLIRETLSTTGWSQRRLAIYIGIHYVTLNRLLHGDRIKTRLSQSQRSKLERLCHFHPYLASLCESVDWEKLHDTQGE